MAFSYGADKDVFGGMSFRAEDGKHTTMGTKPSSGRRRLCSQAKAMAAAEQER